MSFEKLSPMMSMSDIERGDLAYRKDALIPPKKIELRSPPHKLIVFGIPKLLFSKGYLISPIRRPAHPASQLGRCCRGVIAVHREHE
jgi:hypothetical protein